MIGMVDMACADIVDNQKGNKARGERLQLVREKVGGTVKGALKLTIKDHGWFDNLEFSVLSPSYMCI